MYSQEGIVVLAVCFVVRHHVEPVSAAELPLAFALLLVEVNAVRAMTQHVVLESVDHSKVVETVNAFRLSAGVAVAVVVAAVVAPVLAMWRVQALAAAWAVTMASAQEAIAAAADGEPANRLVPVRLPTGQRR